MGRACGVRLVISTEYFNSNERRGPAGNLSSPESDEFRKFATDIDLVDVPLLGRKFTWYRVDGSVG